MRRSELVGKRFGKQTVLSVSNRKNYVVVQCDCGNIHEIRTDVLMNPGVVSCGCYRKKKMGEIGKDTALRIASNKPRRGSKAGVKGVSYDYKNETYRATICLNYKSHYLGSFKKLSDAAAARRRAEDALFKPIIEAARQSAGSAT